MLFSADAWPGIADGSITVTFRAWKRAQAKTGGRYRVAGMLIEATDVRRVAVTDITTQDARRAGAASLDALLGRLATNEPVWRVDFRFLGDDDRIARRTATAQADIDAVIARLARFDRAGPWSATTLRLIENHPGIVSTTLARHAGLDRPAFKLNVRKLKELGLTESLDTGYRLTPRGEAVLRAIGEPRPVR